MSRRIIICFIGLTLSCAVFPGFAEPQAPPAEPAVNLIKASNSQQVLLEQRQQIEDLQRELSSLQERLEVQEYEQSIAKRELSTLPVSSGVDTKSVNAKNITGAAPATRVAPWANADSEAIPESKNKTQAMA